MNSDFIESEHKVGDRVIIETLYNDISVYVDKETGYYYAGKICSDNDKRFEHLAENQDYADYKSAVSATTGIPVVELTKRFQGMPNGYRSDWIHPLLVNEVARWANKSYAVKVSMLMNEIARQAIIEKTTLQERIDKEHRQTKHLLEAKDKEIAKIKHINGHIINNARRSKHKNRDLTDEVRALRMEIQTLNATAQQQLAAIGNQGDLINNLHQSINMQAATIANQEISINGLHGAIGELEHTVADQTNTIGNLEHTVDVHVATINGLHGAIGELEHTVADQNTILMRLDKQINYSTVVSDAKEEDLVLYISKHKPVRQSIRNKIKEDEIYIALYRGDHNDRNKHIPKHSEIRLDIRNISNAMNLEKQVVKELKNDYVDYKQNGFILKRNAVTDFCNKFYKSVVHYRPEVMLTKLLEVEEQVKSISDFLEHEGEKITFKINNKHITRQLKRCDNSLFVNIGRGKHIMSLDELESAVFS